MKVKWPTVPSTLDLNKLRPEAVCVSVILQHISVTPVLVECGGEWCLAEVCVCVCVTPC